MKTKIAAVAILAVSLSPIACYAASMTDTVTEPVTNAAHTIASEASDTAITTQVKVALAAKPGLSSTGINVTTINGVVHLDGKVQTTGQFNDAVEVANKVNGVTSVDTSKLVVEN